MSILAKLTDGKVELTDGWTNRVLCALDITSAALLATEIQAIAAVYKVKAPNPMPPPALGMRVWTVHNVESVSGAKSMRTEAFDIAEMSDGDDWTGWTVPAHIVIIIDFRTGEVIWRRS